MVDREENVYNAECKKNYIKVQNVAKCMVKKTKEYGVRVESLDIRNLCLRVQNLIYSSYSSPTRSIV